MRAQISFQPCQFTLGPRVGAAVVEHAEMRAAGIEAVVQRAPGVLAVQVKLVVSHRPSWLLDAALGSTNAPLHAIAKRYGVCCVVAGHVHQLIHAQLEGVTYLSLPSAGGHLRLSGKYEDGWFFGWTGVEVRDGKVVFQVHALDGAATALSAWGRAGLLVR